MSADEYPFVPKSSVNLRPGQFWSIPLSDGRFACGRVLATIPKGKPGSRSSFIAAHMDWVGEIPPTAETIAGAAVLQSGQANVRAIAASGGAIFGIRSLELDGITPPSDIATYFGDTSLLAQSEYIFVRGSPRPLFERRQISSPLTEDMLKPFTSPTGAVQFNSKLSTRDLKRLADFLESNPNIGLRVFGEGAFTDLEFLRFFPNLSAFSADALFNSLTSLDGLRHLSSDLRSLTIGATRSKLDLKSLGRFRELRSLSIEGQTKNIEVLADLNSLEELTLRSVSLPDLSLLMPLASLRSLDLKLGGTRDLGLLPRLSSLEHLELWMVKGLDDLGPVGELPNLRYLFLQALRRVETLPDFDGTPQLKRLHLETMKGIHNLEPIVSATALTDLLVVDMPQLEVDNLRCLVGHPSLTAVSAGLGSIKRNDTAAELLGLPAVNDFKPPWRTV